MYSIEFGGIQNFQMITKKHLGKIRKLQSKANLIVYDGFDNCKWNGGRINEDIKLRDYQKYFELLNISIACTFSNYKIDLDDPIGNTLLKQLNTGYVILNNDELNNFIITNYPTLTRILSYTSNDTKLEHYLEKENYYDLIVPKIDLLFDDNFIKNINTKKYQILLDEQCNKCPIFFEHYNEMSDFNYNQIQVDKNIAKAKHTCYLEDFNKSNTIGLDLISRKHISRLLNIGFEHFKIPGREKTFEYNEQVFLNAYEIFMDLL